MHRKLLHIGSLVILDTVSRGSVGFGKMDNSRRRSLVIKKAPLAYLAKGAS